MSWHTAGYEGAKQEEKRLDAQHGPSRFWMKDGNSQKEIVFIDDEPFGIYEHQPKINGDWKNWITCLAGSQDDVACCLILQQKAPKYYAGYYTVVDCTEATSEDSKKYMYEMKYLPAKLGTVKKFKLKKESREEKSLVGCLYTVSRTSSKAPSVGEDFEFKRMVVPAKLFEVATYKGRKLSEMWNKAESSAEEMEKLKRLFKVKMDPQAQGKLLREVVPFNYMELLQPKSSKEIRLQLAGANIEDRDGSFGGSSGGGSAPKVEGDIPF